MLRFLPFCTLSLLAAFQWNSASAQSETGSQTFDPQAAQSRYSSVRRQFTLVPNIPDPISRAELHRYAEILNLSTPQIVFLEFIFDEYWKELGKTTDNELRVLLAHSRLVRAWRGRRVNWQYLADYEAYIAQRQIVLDRIVDTDEQFFFTLTGGLDIEQTERMWRVRLHRERSRSLRSDFRTFAAQVDLSRLIENANLDKNSMKRIDRLMESYEQAATPHFQRMLAPVGERRLAMARAEVRMWIDEGDEVSEEDRLAGIDGEEYHRLCREALAEPARLQDVIKRLNESYVDRISAELDDEEAKWLNRAYCDLAYGSYFPDRGDPNSLYQEMSRFPSLRDEDRALLEAIWTPYRHEYNSLCGKLYLAFDTYRYEFSKSNLARDWMTDKKEAEALSAKRFDLNHAVVKRLRNALPPEAREEMERDIHHYLAKAGR